MLFPSSAPSLFLLHDPSEPLFRPRSHAGRAELFGGGGRGQSLQSRDRDGDAEAGRASHLSQVSVFASDITLPRGRASPARR